jgi:hypothetical protein
MRAAAAVPDLGDEREVERELKSSGRFWPDDIHAHLPAIIDRARALRAETETMEIA